ncbi:hypothetical protein JL720_10551 [Aureococcus anophagefferens]|nr:hypothetical protein JL720_10551 [Aureococcus anophagefferens]
MEPPGERFVPGARLAASAEAIATCSRRRRVARRRARRRRRAVAPEGPGPALSDYFPLWAGVADDWKLDQESCASPRPEARAARFGESTICPLGERDDRPRDDDRGYANGGGYEDRGGGGGGGKSRGTALRWNELASSSPTTAATTSSAT